MTTARPAPAGRRQRRSVNARALMDPCAGARRRRSWPLFDSPTWRLGLPLVRGGSPAWLLRLAKPRPSARRRRQRDAVGGIHVVAHAVAAGSPLPDGGCKGGPRRYVLSGVLRNLNDSSKWWGDRSRRQRECRSKGERQWTRFTSRWLKRSLVKPLVIFAVAPRITSAHTAWPSPLQALLRATPPALPRRRRLVGTQCQHQ